jgi:uncharacterized protein (TIGR03067 family)
MNAAVILFVVLVASGANDDQETAKPDGDRAKLQGTWAGKLAGLGVDLLLEIRGDGVTITSTAEEDADAKRTVKGEYKLNETTTPKQWDFLNGTNSEGTKIPDSFAIYELKGDELRLLSIPNSRERPKSFEGADPTLVVKLRRVTKADEKAKPTERPQPSEKPKESPKASPKP